MMKKWKVIIEHNSKLVEVEIEAVYYSEAYIKAEVEYPGCIIKSIKQIQG